jgi:flagellar biogenesis protein FliO
VAKEDIPKEAKADAATAQNAIPKTPNEKTTAMTMGKISTEVENELTIISAKLSKTPSWKQLDVEDHGTFVQIRLPGTVVASSGEFFEGNGPYLKKIATFEVNDVDGAIRLFVNQDASKIKLATTAEVLGERVIITIDHKKLEQLIQPAKSNTQSENGLASASASSTTKSEAVATENIPNGSAVGSIKSDGKELSKTEAASIVSSTSNSEKVTSQSDDVKIGASADSLNLRDKLMTAAAFCAAMLMFLIGSTMYRNRRLKNLKISRALDQFEPAAMRVLNNINISNRQKLSLVQVGSQQILIGISPDNISYLTTVETPSRASNQSSFNTQLVNANPNAGIKLKQMDQQVTRPQRRPADSGTTSKPVPRDSQSSNTPSQSSRINYGVGDDGVSDMRRGQKIDKGNPDQPYDDITKIIRDRLRNLPPGP